MKKVLSLVLVLALCLSLFAACGESKATDSYEIALITDAGKIDDKSFNQGAWEGVVAYAEANDITYKYYKPGEVSDAAYEEAIELAVAGGAKVIVTPGFLFEVAIYNEQTKHPDVHFILLDGAPHTADYSTFKTEANTASVMYAEEQVGYLAGYAAVKDGYKSLGFEGGMAVPAVIAYGVGYLQGANDAAKELGITVPVQYHYTGDFAETPKNKATALTMYTAGAEVIFACGGSVGKSVMIAADEQGKKVIGVDIDQREDSATVITSAMKGLGSSVEQVLTAYYSDNFAEFGGKTTYFDAAKAGVSLAPDFDRFNSFTEAEYQELFAKMVNNEISIKRTVNDNNVATADQYETELGLTNVDVTVIS